LNTEVTTAEIVNVPNIPDHKGVLVVTGDVGNRGKGYWKLNTAMLDKDDYKQNIKETINQTLNELSDIKDLTLIWDVIKIRIKEMSIKYSIQSLKKEKCEIKQLEQKLGDMEIMHIAGNMDICEQDLNDIKSRIKDAYDEKALNQARADQIRSRAQYIEEGEKSTKFFLSLEKKEPNKQ
jgi:hypothetical protein